MLGRSSTPLAALVQEFHLVEASTACSGCSRPFSRSRTATVRLMLSQRWPLAKTWIQAGFGVAGASSGPMNKVPLVNGVWQTLKVEELASWENIARRTVLSRCWCCW